ncbi:MAG: cell wall-binding repeat-containing protein [Tissierellia bacterium]|nr:cell wall-binding repeat-containing protein [Tissierellia bacterium]
MKIKIIRALALIICLSLLPLPVMADNGTENVKNIVVNTDNDDEIVIKKIAERLGDSNSELFIASNSVFADSLVGGVLIAEKNGKLIYNEYLNDEDSLLSEATKLTILGGETRVSNESIESSDKFSGRIAGEDRYETAVKIAEELGKDRNLIIVNGENYPDALSATALAAEKDMNILLVKTDELPKATEEYLRECGKKDILFVGGLASLSKEVKDRVLEVNGHIGIDSEILTLAGKDRYETSNIVARQFHDIKTAVIVEGDNYAKALSASVLAANYGSPLILINPLGLIDAEITNDIQSIENLFLLPNINTMNIENLKDVYNNLSGNSDIILDLHGNEIKIESLTAYEIEEEIEVEETPVEEPVAEPVEQDIIETLPSGDKINKTKQIITLADGTVKKYRAVKAMNSTAYNIFPGSTGYTRSGTPARPGVVAVDPNVIPLMTQLYIVSNDEWPSYGLASAEDTGGAIIGDIVDLFYTSADTVWAYGRRDVTVYILED